MKKVLSFVLALALVLAVAAPAFATSTVPTQDITDPGKLGTGVTNKVTGTTSVGTLKVTVPTANGIVLNPYGLTLKVSALGKEDSDSTASSSEQIISPAQQIVSTSTSQIEVKVVATGIVGGNTKLVATDPDSDEKTNAVHLKLHYKAGSAEIADGDRLNKLSGGTDLDLTTKATAATSLGTMASGIKADGSDNPQYIDFQLQGAAAQNPTSPWTTKDTVGATLAFTFAPVA